MYIYPLYNIEPSGLPKQNVYVDFEDHTIIWFAETGEVKTFCNNYTTYEVKNYSWELNI